MPTLQRSVAPRGARFYQAGDEVMFVRQLDASTREGPREATDEDRAAHPEAWREFAAPLSLQGEGPGEGGRAGRAVTGGSRRKEAERIIGPPPSIPPPEGEGRA